MAVCPISVRQMKCGTTELYLASCSVGYAFSVIVIHINTMVFPFVHTSHIIKDQPRETMNVCSRNERRGSHD